MTPEEVAAYVGESIEQVLARRVRTIGTTEKMWRCGQTGNIVEGTYNCSCDSVICDLGEWVTVTPATN